MKIVKSSNNTSSTTAMSQHIRGQGLTEYAIILSLVAVAAIGATSYFGDAVKSRFVALGSELSGDAEYDTKAATSAALAKAKGDVSAKTTLRNYSN